MNIILFVSLLFTLQLIYWLVGKRAAKQVSGKEDYFLAGKSVRLFPLMMTFLATQVGGGVILGAADEAYQFGWPVLLYPFGCALGLILLGSGIGRRLSEFKVGTVAEIFEKVYKSPFLRKTASLLSVISLFMILVAQITASHKFLMSLGLSSTPLFILFWMIVIIYTAQGGLKAVISTDMVQAAFFSLIFLFCFACVMMTPMASGVFKIPDVSAFTGVSSKFCGWLFMPLLFMVIEQDMGQRCFAGASSKVVSRASFIAGIVTFIVCIVPVFLGTLARKMGLEIPSGESVLMHVTVKTTAPWVSALVGCAVLAAIISTATSLINAISSNLSGDFKLSFLKRWDLMKTVKGITCVISLSGVFCAFYFNNIVDILIISYELSVSCLFVPLIMGLFKKEGRFISALLSLIFGALAFFSFHIYTPWIPKEILCIVISFSGYALGEVFSSYKLKNQNLLKD